MAEITHNQFPGIVIETDSGVEEGGFWSYKARVGDGNYFDLPSATPFDPATLEAGINDPKSPVYGNVTALLYGLEDTGGQDRGLFAEVISPALQRTPASILGAPVDIGNLALAAIVDTPVNFLDWAFGGFEGDMPGNRYVSSEVPVLGSEHIAQQMENVGDLARKGIQLTEEAGWNVEIPPVPFTDILGLGGVRVGARTLAEFFAFDTTPDESSKTRQYISLITQIIGAAPVEGALIAKLAVQLAKTTKNPTAQHVYEAISEMHVNNPKKAAALEAGMGAAVGGGMVASLEGLEAAYPEAPQWMKNLVMAGGGLILPIGGMTAASTAWDIGINTAVVSIPLRILRGATDSLTVSGAERAAARAIQTMGGDWKHRGEILGVTGQLRLALKEGRNMDEATRIAFTTPQLARNEAAVLEAQLNAAAQNMPPADVSAQRQLIEELRRFANFQEGQLQTLSSSDGVGAVAYAKYSEQMMDRRDSIFSALDDAILKLDLGGRSDDGVDASVMRADYEQGLATGTFEYNNNRIRAFQEGRLGSLEPEQARAISEAYEVVLTRMDKGAQDAIRSAEQRVAAIRDGMPKDMSDQDRMDFNMWIRREVNTAYQEVDALEDLLWNNIGGMNTQKTASYVNLDGVDMGPQILIDGVSIGEYFAAKAAGLKAGEAENQSKWLWKLAGRNALINEASKAGGPDAEKIARQNVVINNNEKIVVQRQQELDAASAKLGALVDVPYESPALRNAMARVRQLEGELETMPEPLPGSPPDNNRGRLERLLAGARAKVVELGAPGPGAVDPNLTRAQNAFEKAQVRVNEAQIRLDTARENLEIFLGKGVDHEGNAVNLSDEISDGSVLGVRTVDDILVGRDAQEVQNIISHLKAEMSFEQGRSNRRPAKIMAIGDLIDDLQRAIADPENFSVDTLALDAARKMTATKKTLFEKGDIGRLRGFTTKGEPEIPPERTIERIAPATAQETNLRQLETALSARYETMTGEGTPFRFETRDDGTLTLELDPDFNLQRYSETPPAPFEHIQVDGGRSLGLRLVEGTQPTAANIEMIQKTLWDRFKGFGTGDEFNSAAADRWIQNNSDAIRWLREATGKDTGFETLAGAERVVQAINNATTRNLDNTVKIMEKAGAFNDQFTERGFRLLVREAAKRESDIQSAAIFLDNPDPTTIGPNFLDKFLRNPEILGETLKVLENGVLPDGTNPALHGFKQAVAEALIDRALTNPGSGTLAGQQANTLSASLGTTVRLWDPQALIGLAQDPKVGRLLGELYGNDAPELFRKIAEGARLQSAVSESATPGVSVRDAVSDEWAGNIGRIIGGWLARYTPISSLVMTGVGRRYGMAAIANVRGSAIDKLIVDFLMNSDLAAAAIKKYPVRSPHADESMRRRAFLWAHQKFIGDNARRIQRLGNTPGVLYEVGEPTKYQELEENNDPTRIGPQSSLQPAGPPNRRVSNIPTPRPLQKLRPPRAPSQASVLSQVDPVGPRPTGQVSEETLAGLSQVGLPLFAGHGGYITAGAGSGVGRMEESGIMSIQCKPRQIVG